MSGSRLVRWRVFLYALAHVDRGFFLLFVRQCGVQYGPVCAGFDNKFDDKVQGISRGFWPSGHIRDCTPSGWVPEWRGGRAGW
jgi:hypothetical protein